MSAREFANLLHDFGPALANHLWQSTAFAAMAAALAFALRRNQARARYWVWMAASLKFLVPFALLAGAAGRLAPARVVAPADAGVYMAVDQASEPFAVPTLPVGSVLRVQPPLQWAALVLAAVWAVGFLAVLATWCVRWRRVARVVRSAMRVMEGRELAALERIATEAGVRRTIQMRVSESALEPGVFGIVRPVLLWPAAISARLADEQLDAVMAHEVCHVRRRDNLTAVLHMFVEAVFWFHPLMWWVGARLLAERERACDEAVVALCPQPQVYVESILKVCEFCVESPLVCVAGITGADLKRRVVDIMTARVVRRLSLGAKIAIAAVAALAVAVPVVLGTTRILPLYGEIATPTGPLPSMEAATIKPANPEVRGKGFRIEGRHIKTINTSLSDLLAYAYDIQARQMVGLPAWAESDKYEIEGVAPSDQPGEPNWKFMMRKLLADRFGLQFHTGTMEMPVYELHVGKNGPKLGEVQTAPGQGSLYLGPASPGPGVTLHAKGQTMAGLAKLLEGTELARPVVDRTGITGKFDFEMTFSSDRIRKGGDGAAPPMEDEPNAPPGIFTAIQDQLGLKLEPAKGPVETMVIDHIQKPELDVAASGASMGLPAQTGSGSVNSSDQAHTPDKPSVDSSAALVAQKTTAKAERYEAATVKLAPTRDSMSPEQWRALTSKFGAHVDGTLAEYTNMSLMQLISEAFGTPPYAIAGPDWLSLWRPQYFDIVARMPDGATQDDAPKMLQALLMDRFHLQIHREMQMKPVLAMIVAKDGPKLKPSPPTAPIDGPVQDVKHADGTISSNMGIHGRLLQRFDPQTQTLHLEASKLSMDEFADRLTGLMQSGNESKRRVVNETGLKGDYQIMIDFSIADQVAAARAHGVIPSTPGSPQTEASDPNGLSTLVSSVKKLGLDLQPRTALVPVLVVDQADRIPTQN